MESDRAKRHIDESETEEVVRVLRLSWGEGNNH